MNSKQRDYRTGSLPDRFPLATALTPMQDSADPAYESSEALSRGTLFPGLDLPFMNVDFVVHELGLYLDTHAEDDEAFALFQSFLAMQKEARRRIIEICGPMKKTDLIGADRYTWLLDPWPWDYSGRKER